MNKIVLVGLIFSVGFTSISAQKFFTKTGNVSFFSRTTMENIDAVTNTANCVLDMTTGNIEMAVLIKSFIFPKALMQEHFNENYMESTKFPKAVFKGTITNIKEFSMNMKGKFKGALVGSITIHGVTQPIENVVNLNPKEGKIAADLDFNVKLKDFEIEVPALVKDNISREIKVEVNTVLEELKKAQ